MDKTEPGMSLGFRATLSFMANLRARKLRANQTDAERRLWSVLRNRRLGTYKFRRQHRLGIYFVDFVCIEHRLIIEADGGQHVDSAYDDKRTAWLMSQGWRVIRFWNDDILANTEAVILAIVEALDSPTAPSPSQPTAGSLPLPRSRARGNTS